MKMSRAWPGGEPSQRMCATAWELLWRQRVIHPFPCNQEEVICSLLPPEAQDFFFDGPQSVVKDMQWENLTHCVTLGRSITIEIDGETGRGFWLSSPVKHPVPTGPGKAFSIYSNNLHWREIVDWYGPAMDTHRKLLKYQQALSEFFTRASHPEIVERYWPELHKFVDFPLAPSQMLSKEGKRKRRMVPMPTHDDCTGIIETLAGSTLLAPYKCTAWVGYEAEE